MSSNSTDSTSNSHPLFESLDADSLALFLVQVVIILILVRLLAKLLALVHQPPVIGEIIAGVILGPSVFGFIPGFTDTIFPPQSLPIITIFAQVGLIFFMFFLGLEIDPIMLTKNWQSTIPIALTAILVPFAAGAGISFWLYTVEVTNSEKDVFLLFVGTILAFTAFPVLARILTSFRLIDTPFGLHALSIAAIDDVFAWCTLAITLSYAGGGSAISGVYTMLIIIGFMLFLMLCLRPVLFFLRGYLRSRRKIKLAAKDLDRDYVGVLFLLLCLNSIFTQLLGIHAFFGAFAFGLIVPKDDMMLQNVAPKIELLIVEFFLPLYFANSGLSTQLQSLNTGESWGITILVILICTVSKVIPITAVTYYTSVYFKVTGEEDDEAAVKAWEEERELSIKQQELEAQEKKAVKEHNEFGQKPKSKEEIELQSIAVTSKQESRKAEPELPTPTEPQSASMPSEEDTTVPPASLDQPMNNSTDSESLEDGNEPTSTTYTNGVTHRTPRINGSSPFRPQPLTTSPSPSNYSHSLTPHISNLPPAIPKNEHLPLRTCFIIGVLMNTSGLVALIALNIGLDRKILGPKVFTMLVLMALATTFMTSPIFYRFFVVDYMKALKIKRAWARRRAYEKEKRRTSVSGTPAALTIEEEEEQEREIQRIEAIEEKAEADQYEIEKDRVSISIPKRLSMSKETHFAFPSTDSTSDNVDNE